MHLGTLETMTFTETCKWMLWLAKSRGLAQKHEGRLHHHENIEDKQLLDNMGIVRRLQREKTLWASLSDSAKAAPVLAQVLVLEQRQC